MIKVNKKKEVIYHISSKDSSCFCSGCLIRWNPRRGDSGISYVNHQLKKKRKHCLKQLQDQNYPQSNPQMGPTSVLGVSENITKETKAYAELENDRENISETTSLNCSEFESSSKKAKLSGCISPNCPDFENSSESIKISKTMSPNCPESENTLKRVEVGETKSHNCPELEISPKKIQVSNEDQDACQDILEYNEVSKESDCLINDEKVHLIALKYGKILEVFWQREIETPEEFESYLQQICQEIIKELNNCKNKPEHQLGEKDMERLFMFLLKKYMNTPQHQYLTLDVLARQLEFWLLANC